MFIEDENLPLDVLRKFYDDFKHALCCLECGLESIFDPTLSGSIGRPLAILLRHHCESEQGERPGKGA